MELDQGGFIVLPRAALRIGSITGELMAMVTLGGFEGFFSAFELGRPQSSAEVNAIAAEFGPRFLPEEPARTA